GNRNEGIGLLHDPTDARGQGEGIARRTQLVHHVAERLSRITSRRSGISWFVGVPRTPAFRASLPNRTSAATRRRPSGPSRARGDKPARGRASRRSRGPKTRGRAG